MTITPTDREEVLRMLTLVLQESQHGKLEPSKCTALYPAASAFLIIGSDLPWSKFKIIGNFVAWRQALTKAAASRKPKKFASPSEVATITGDFKSPAAATIAFKTSAVLKLKEPMAYFCC